MILESRIGMEKYGRSDGKVQETGKDRAAREMMTRLGFRENVISRVEYLVGHHHTYKDIDGLDYQVLVEADFLVNYLRMILIGIYQEKCRNNFKTETGKKIVKEMFFPESFQKSVQYMGAGCAADSGGFY